MLSGDPDAAALLSGLIDDGVLVTAYEDSAGPDAVYRYHPLLVELIRRQVANSSGDAAIVATAHRRAAEHDAAHGDPVSALEHASQARDDIVLADLLVELAPRCSAAPGRSS